MHDLTLPNSIQKSRRRVEQSNEQTARDREEQERRSLVAKAWGRLYRPEPYPYGERPQERDDWLRGWSYRLAIFGWIASREGYGGAVDELSGETLGEEIAADVLRSSLTPTRGSLTQTAARVFELLQACPDSTWAMPFNGDVVLRRVLGLHGSADRGEPETEAAGEAGRDDADAESEIEAAQPISPKSKSEQRARWLAEAMLLVRDHPDWSDASIAERVGRHKSQLSRSPEYQTAAALARDPQRDPPKGRITVDPRSGLTDVEAYSEDPQE
ncbi:MAG: hypothetical protein DWQ34_16950 [Planctomycetota bacterium]|nr:MAG: hypothetical protein DWQ34_16950 [Planctomycetota bacterium]REK28351.1 MAG: hypothetical protein DWQ41_06135 [Planctomycetota bacterium]